MRRVAGLLSIVSLALAAPASAAPRKVVPAQITLARYVCLGYDTGTGFMSEQQSILAPETVTPEDRRALELIHEQIESWGRYVITTRSQDAELLIAVRIGRRASIGSGLGVGAPGGRAGRTGGVEGFGGSVELSSPYDTLTVYESHGGRVGAQLWRVQRKGALSGEPPKAFEELRLDVEASPAPARKP